MFPFFLTPFRFSSRTSTPNTRIVSMSSLYSHGLKILAKTSGLCLHSFTLTHKRLLTVSILDDGVGLCFFYTCPPAWLNEWPIVMYGKPSNTHCVLWLLNWCGKSWELGQIGSRGADRDRTEITVLMLAFSALKTRSEYFFFSINI